MFRSSHLIPGIKYVQIIFFFILLLGFTHSLGNVSRKGELSHDGNEVEVSKSQQTKGLNSTHLNQELKNDTTGGEKEEKREIALWGWRWEEVNTYLVVSLFLLVAALVKLGYHHTAVHRHVPESCILIILGTLFELTIFLTNAQEYTPQFSSEYFFFLLLPPIILESAYSLHDRVFFTNLGTILLYAIIGTLINVFMIGPSLYFLGKTGAYGWDTKISFIECLVFSTLISAVDPVAVLAIFQEIGVNKALYFMVFGESLLNDAVVIALYNSMTIFAEKDSISLMDVVTGILNFFTVSGGGLFIGVFLGGLTAILTRCTEDVRVVEPMIIIIMAYMAYVGAELFHFSGIIGIVGCGLMQVEYAKHNISSRSYVTIKYFTKTLSSIADVIIFFFLGQVLVRENHVWNTVFVSATVVFCIIYRFFSVFSLTLIANNFFGRVRFINSEEQLVMAYGGLRGAIAFSLSIMLNKDKIGNADLFVTTTLFIILFTVIVMGSTTKTIVRLLRVKTEGKRDPKMFIFLHEKSIETFMSGIEDISGNRSYHHGIQKLSQLNDKYFKKIFVSGWVSNSTGFTEAYEKVKNTRPRSMVIADIRNNRSNKNVRFANGTTDPDQKPWRLVKHPQPNNISTSTPAIISNGNIVLQPPHSLRWSLLKNVVNFSNRIKRETDSNENVEEGRLPTPPPETRRRRKSSIISLMRENSEEREVNQARRTLTSAMSRTSFYGLPGSIYVEALDSNSSPDRVRIRGKTKDGRNRNNPDETPPESSNSRRNNFQRMSRVDTYNRSLPEWKR